MVQSLFQEIIRIPVPFNMIVLVVLFGCIAGIIGTIAKEIRKYACHTQDIAFKRELVERGLDGDEIERIVAAEVTGNDAPVVIGGNCYVGERAATS